MITVSQLNRMNLMKNDLKHYLSINILPKIRLFLKRRPIAWGNLLGTTIAMQIGTFGFAVLVERNIPYFELIAANIIVCFILIVGAGFSRFLMRRNEFWKTEYPKIAQTKPLGEQNLTDLSNRQLRSL